MKNSSIFEKKLIVVPLYVISDDLKKSSHQAWILLNTFSAILIVIQLLILPRKLAIFSRLFLSRVLMQLHVSLKPLSSNWSLKFIDTTKLLLHYSSIENIIAKKKKENPSQLQRCVNKICRGRWKLVKKANIFVFTPEQLQARN